MNGNTPKQRAKQLSKELKALYDDCAQDETNVTDCLTDLIHLCAHRRVDFDRCLRSARNLAYAENTQGGITP